MSDPKFGRIYLNRQQLEYLVRMTEMADPKDAIERFAVILLEERVDPAKMNQYIDKLMEKEAAK